MTALTKVELRKMTDTRSGFWLLASLAGGTVLIVILLLALHDASDHSVRDVMEGAVQPAALILPVAGILLVTAEWSQRTALTTFALVPDRHRVLAAKFGAALALSAIALLFTRAATQIGVLVSERSLDDHVWNLPLTMLGQHFVLVATGMLMGVAFGALFLSSAPAIVLYFVLPIALATIGDIFSVSFLDWIDGTRSLAPLAEHALSAREWAQAGTTLLLWLGLPAALGWWRVSRAEIA